MSEDGKRRNLGRGLSALLGDNTEDYASLDKLRVSRMVPVEQVFPGRFQPRRRFDEAKIAELVESVREKGILQPILVRRRGEESNSFEIVAGERRWRAAQAAGLHEIPVVVKELSDREAMEIALVENLQRQDLSPLEEAEGYRRLMEEFDHSQEEMAKVVGKSRSHLANMMRLLNLPQPVKDMVESGALSAGHARALLSTPDPVALAQQVVKRGLNVRQTEKLSQAKPKTKTVESKAPAGDADLLSLQRSLSNLLGLRVTITFQGKSGELTIHYTDIEQLDDILHRLSHGAAPPPEEPEEPGIFESEIPDEDILADFAGLEEEEVPIQRQRKG